MWPYRHAHDVPLVTLILNIYGFVGLTSSVNRRYTDKLFTLYSIDNALLWQCGPTLLPSIICLACKLNQCQLIDSATVPLTTIVCNYAHLYFMVYWSVY